ncbi:MAG: 2-oxo acid dehydrogenase subunit E2 [Gammaproteobacteria bacterium]|nr:MAG: 2-oxo acid dehydrogenase subunit E2 [Gammaproteobacteria bacterium]
MSEFLMPSLGADMEEATLVQWLVKPGDRVKRGDVIAVVETSKGAIEIEVFEDGRVEQLRIQEGENAPVGAPLADILSETGGAKPTTSDESAAEPTVTQTAKPEPRETPPPKEGTYRASPAARKRAAELGLDLAVLHGNGPDGAVTLADVESAAKKMGVELAEPFDRKAMRQTIATAMARSKREIPHYYLATTVDMRRVLAWLQDYNRERAIKERLSYLALTLKAVALSLHKVPELNGFYSENAFHPVETVNIGMAVSLRGGGLIAPALGQVEQRSLKDLMAHMNDLIERTRRGTLRATELSSATITISNMGERGVETLYGVITPPQVALVGLGKLVDKPFVENEQVIVCPQMQVTLSADHRASDGHRGALFLNNLAHLLQTPEAL